MAEEGYEIMLMSWIMLKENALENIPTKLKIMMIQNKMENKLFCVFENMYVDIIKIVMLAKMFGRCILIMDFMFVHFLK